MPNGVNAVKADFDRNGYPSIAALFDSQSTFDDSGREESATKPWRPPFRQLLVFVLVVRKVRGGNDGQCLLITAETNDLFDNFETP